MRGAAPSGRSVRRADVLCRGGGAANREYRADGGPWIGHPGRGKQARRECGADEFDRGGLPSLRAFGRAGRCGDCWEVRDAGGTAALHAFLAGSMRGSWTDEASGRRGDALDLAALLRGVGGAAAVAAAERFLEWTADRRSEGGEAGGGQMTLFGALPERTARARRRRQAGTTRPAMRLRPAAPTRRRLRRTPNRKPPGRARARPMRTVPHTARKTGP